MKSLAKQFGGFLAVGGLSGCILLASNYLLHDVLKWPENISYPSSFVPVIFTNFFMMRKVVMPSDDPRWGRQFLAFIASTLLWRGLESLAGLLLFRTNLNYYLLVIGNAGFFTVLKFVYYKLTVFAPKRVTQDVATGAS